MIQVEALVDPHNLAPIISDEMSRPELMDLIMYLVDYENSTNLANDLILELQDWLEDVF